QLAYRLLRRLAVQIPIDFTEKSQMPLISCDPNGIVADLPLKDTAGSPCDLSIGMVPTKLSAEFDLLCSQFAVHDASSRFAQFLQTLCQSRSAPSAHVRGDGFPTAPSMLVRSVPMTAPAKGAINEVTSISPLNRARTATECKISSPLRWAMGVRGT